MEQIVLIKIKLDLVFDLDKVIFINLILFIEYSLNYFFIKVVKVNIIVTHLNKIYYYLKVKIDVNLVF